MASQLDNVVKIKRFNDLKARIKNECLRRKYIGSVENYGKLAWDFEHTPTNNTVIETEQYGKLSVPIRKINWKTTPNGPLDRVINDADLLNFETRIAAFETRNITSRATTDCASSCTGTCTTTCDTSCYTTCTGGCGGSCSGTCSGDCYGDCYGGCTDNCTAACKTECGLVACGWGCQGACISVCANEVSCEAECSSACYGKCFGSCVDVCGGNCGNVSNPSPT